MDKFIPFTVVSCSEHDDKSAPTLYEMDKIAWKIDSDKKPGAAGFIRTPKDFKQAMKDGKVQVTAHDEEYNY